MCRKGGKGGRLLPSCGREAGGRKWARKEVGGVAKASMVAQRWEGVQKKRGMHKGARKRRGRGKGEGQRGGEQTCSLMAGSRLFPCPLPTSLLGVHAPWPCLRALALHTPWP